MEKTPEELAGKIEGANKALNALMDHGKNTLKLSDGALQGLMERGPNTVQHKKNSIAGMGSAELKVELKMINACVKNLGAGFQKDHGLAHKKITAIIRGSDSDT